MTEDVGDNKMSKPVDIEHVYEQAGGMGSYQWILVLLMAVITFLAAESLSINFVAGHQDHWCSVKELQTISHGQQKYIAIPRDAEGNYKSCEKFDINYASLTQNDLAKWNRSQMKLNTSTVKCDAWVYDQSTFVSTVTSRYNLVCSDKWMISMISTLYMAGILVGSIFGGYISDRFGRKKALCGFLLSKIVVNLMSALSRSYTVLAIARFLMGVSTIPCTLTSFVLAVEQSPPVWRTGTAMVLNVAFSFGFMVWAGLGYAIRDDVKLQLAMSIPITCLLSYWWLVDESPLWLLQKKRCKSATAILNKIALTNKSPLADDFDSHDIHTHTMNETNSDWLSLFGSPMMRRRSLVVNLYWFTVSLMYFALSLNMGALSGDLFINTFISGAVEIPACIICTLCLAWRVTGRRLTCSLSLVIAGVASYISVYMIIQDIGVAHTTFATVARGFVSIAFSAIYVYSPELFPTEVRTIGMGTASMCARISGMAASYVGGPLGDVWAPLPPIIYGTFAVVAGLLILLLPETRGKPLPKTIREVEQLSRPHISVSDYDNHKRDDELPLNRL